VPTLPKPHDYRSRTPTPAGARRLSRTMLDTAWICRPCRKTFTILPEWLVPSARFTLHCRQQACERIAAGHPVEQAAPHCQDPSRSPASSSFHRGRCWPVGRSRRTGHRLRVHPGGCPRSAATRTGASFLLEPKLPPRRWRQLLRRYLANGDLVPRPGVIRRQSLQVTVMKDDAGTRDPSLEPLHDPRRLLL